MSVDQGGRPNIITPGPRGDDAEGPRTFYRSRPNWLIRSTQIVEGAPPSKPQWFHFFDRFDTTRSVFVWIMLHILLGQLAKASPMVGTIHAWVTFTVCIYLAMSSRRIMIVVAAMGYAACGDVLWRMTFSHAPWELSKYMVLVMSAIILIRWIGRPNAPLCWAIIVLLMPSLIPTIQQFGPSQLRDRFAFILLALVAMAVACMAMRRLRVEWYEVRVLLFAMLGPMIAEASIAASAVAKLTVADFTSIQSNNAASGGFGANQVSSVLGLGVLLCLFIALQDHNWLNRLMLLTLGMWFMFQSTITLSRGGLANVTLALLVAAPHILLHRRLGLRFLIGMTVALLVVATFLLPRLDKFTGGAVDKRLHDKQTTERGQLAQIDLDLFAQHPLFGVGVGISDKSHRLTESGYAIASHTEYTRLLAEHGLLGLGVMVCMVGLAIEAYRRQTNWFGRAWTSALVAWTLMDLSHASTRNAINGFVFAMAMLAIDEHVVSSRDKGDEEADEVAPHEEYDIDGATGELIVVGPGRDLSSQDRHRAHRAQIRPNLGSPITLDLPELDAPPPNGQGLNGHGLNGSGLNGSS